MNIINIFTNKKKRNIDDLYSLGFHGDKYLLRLVDKLLNKSDYFIETGTNVGSTLLYVAKRFPNIKCLSCEKNKKVFKEARKNLQRLNNVQLFNKDSRTFLKRLKEIYDNIYLRKCTFWLDAHGHGYNWPLKFEIEFITRNFENSFILIDDFKVPNLDCFKYDQYKNQECSFQYIQSSIKYNNYRIIYPNYKEKTSDFHPLKGWILLSSLKNKIFIDNRLKNKLIEQKI